MTTCAFEACTCGVATAGDYCGPSCRMGIGDSAEPCKCGHQDCEKTTGSG